MLKALKLGQIEKIIAACESLNAKHPSPELGVRLDQIAAEHMQVFQEDEKELRSEIESLSYDARMELMALMWLGRDADEPFEDLLEYAHKNSGPQDSVYIAEKSPAVPTYLRDGLALMKAE